MASPLLLRYAQEYATSREMSTELEVLGEGIDGAVWLTSDRTAIEVFENKEQFETETACYLRLTAANVVDIRGFAVPQLIDYDSQRLVIEMTTVQPPYLLDFGKCYLDSKPDFSSEVWNDLYGRIKEIYEDRYDEVMSAVRALQKFGIYYYDVKPKNVLPDNWDPMV